MNILTRKDDDGKSLCLSGRIRLCQKLAVSERHRQEESDCNCDYFQIGTAMFCSESDSANLIVLPSDAVENKVHDDVLERFVALKPLLLQIKLLDKVGDGTADVTICES